MDRNGISVKNISLETKCVVYRLALFVNTPPKHDISVHNICFALTVNRKNRRRFDCLLFKTWFNVMYVTL